MAKLQKFGLVVHSIESKGVSVKTQWGSFSESGAFPKAAK
jgi:hypothetical protein